MDALYRVLLRLLPSDYDRSEMWETYRARVARARASRGALAVGRERLMELLDLLATIVTARWPFPSFDSLIQDVRYGLRSLMRSPLASGLAVVSLALGLGATTAIYSAVDVWLIRPLPLPNGDRLVSVWRSNVDGSAWGALSPPEYRELLEASPAVVPMAYVPTGYNLAIDEGAERVRGLTASANALEVLGIVPLMGRGFAPEEGTPEGQRVALLTEEFWRRAYGADRGILGGTVVLDDLPHTVVGIIPAGQGIPGDVADVWTPLRISSSDSRSANYLRAIALLPPGMDIAGGRAELKAAAASVSEGALGPLFPSVRVLSLREQLYEAGGTGPASILLAIAALLVLMVACANIANIFMARGLGRRHELALRGALGAGRRRLVRQLFVEAAIVGVVGGALGVLVGRVGIDALVTYVLPPQVPGVAQIALDSRVLTGAAVLTGGSVLLFGLLPAMRFSGAPVWGRLVEGGRGGMSERKDRMGSVLIVAEIAATLTLVTLSALTYRSFATLRGTDMGMRTSGALVFRVDLPPASPPGDEGVTSVYRDLDERLASIPGVSGIATSSGHPVSYWSNPVYSVPGRMEEGTIASAELRAVTPSYRSVMQLEMVAGRWFEEGVDVGGSEPVAVVSEALASRWWDEPEDALGQTVTHGNDVRRIVGVVDPGRLRGPMDPDPPAIFEPFSQDPARSTFNVLAHSMDEAQAVAAVRGAVRDVSPGLAVFESAPLDDFVREAAGPVVAALQIFGALGLLSLALTLGGVYGVVAHSVGRRRREMGVRLALGARSAEVIRMMVWRCTKLAAVGIVIGLALSLAGGGALAFVLYGVGPRDPGVLMSVSLLLATVVLVAAYLPARAAARVDPVETLRSE